MQDRDDRRIGQRRLPGFSLVEMAVVLIIFGIVLSAVLPLLNGATAHHKRTETLKRQERILTLLGAFATTYHWALPLPADPMADTSTQGMSTKTTERKHLARINPRLNLGEHAILYVGHIPHRTLEIPAEWALDAWGHPMTYAVVLGTPQEVRAVKAENTQSAANTTGEYAAVTEKESFDGLQVTDGTHVDMPAFIVLVSHGAQGAGALGNAARLSPDQQENANQDAFFVSRTADADFDDIVSFVTVQTFNSLYAPHLKEKIAPITDPLPSAQTQVPSPEGVREEAVSEPEPAPPLVPAAPVVQAATQSRQDYYNALQSTVVVTGKNGL